MCGIAGIAYTNGRPVEHDILEKMTQALVHRGPDDEGIFITRNSQLEDTCWARAQKA